MYPRSRNPPPPYPYGGEGEYSLPPRSTSESSSSKKKYVKWIGIVVVLAIVGFLGWKAWTPIQKFVQSAFKKGSSKDETSTTTTTTATPAATDQSDSSSSSSSSSNSNNSSPNNSSLDSLLNAFEKKENVALVCTSGSLWPESKVFTSLEQALKYCNNQPFCAGVKVSKSASNSSSATYVFVGYHGLSEEASSTTVSYRKKDVVLPANAFTILAGKSCVSLGTGFSNSFSYPSLLAAQMACLSEPRCMGVVQRPDNTWWLAGYLSNVQDLPGAILYAKSSTYQLASPTNWTKVEASTIESNGIAPTASSSTTIPATFSFATPADALRACVANAPECIGCSVSSSNPTEYTFFWKTNATNLRLKGDASRTAYHAPGVAFTGAAVPSVEYTAVGCFADGTNVPAFPYKANGGAKTYTVDACAQEAKAAGFRRFAIREWQASSQTGMCLYGHDDHVRNTRHGSSDVCTKNSSDQTVSTTSNANAVYEFKDPVPKYTNWKERIAIPALNMCLTNNKSTFWGGQDYTWGKMEPCNPNDAQQRMTYDATNKSIRNLNGEYLYSFGPSCGHRSNWSGIPNNNWPLDANFRFHPRGSETACLFYDDAGIHTCDCKNTSEDHRYEIFPA